MIVAQKALGAIWALRRQPLMRRLPKTICFTPISVKTCLIKALLVTVLTPWTISFSVGNWGFAANLMNIIITRIFFDARRCYVMAGERYRTIYPITVTVSRANHKPPLICVLYRKPPVTPARWRCWTTAGQNRGWEIGPIGAALGGHATLDANINWRRGTGNATARRTPEEDTHSGSARVGISSWGHQFQSTLHVGRTALALEYRHEVNGLICLNTTRAAHVHWRTLYRAWFLTVGKYLSGEKPVGGANELVHGMFFKGKNYIVLLITGVLKTKVPTTLWDINSLFY